MKKIKQSIALILAIALVAACSPPSAKNTKFGTSYDALAPVENGFCVIFYKLDDYAIVFVGDSAVYDTRALGMAPKKEVLVDLNPFVRPGNTDMKVEVYNGICSSCNQNRWSVTYEIFHNEESLIYVSDDSNDQDAAVGLSLVEEHDLSAF